MWILHLYVHVNQKSDGDDDSLHINFFFEMNLSIYFIKHLKAFVLITSHILLHHIGFPYIGNNVTFEERNIY